MRSKIMEHCLEFNFELVLFGFHFISEVKVSFAY